MKNGQRFFVRFLQRFAPRLANKENINEFLEKRAFAIASLDTFRLYITLALYLASILSLFHKIKPS